jgi:phthiocerol/phenolphthiocerol synthesis type-I polyketide synthase B
MDSLMSVTLQRALSETLGEVLPASVVFDYPTVDALVEYLATLLPELIEVAEQENADEYDDLSEAELLDRLSQRLDHAR